MRVLYLYILLLLTVPLYAQESDQEFGTEEQLDAENTEADSAENYYEYSDEEQSGEQPLGHTPVKPEDLPGTGEYKSEELYHRTFDEKKWRDIVGNTDFKEDEPPPPTDMNWLPSMAWGGPVLKAIGYGAITAIILLLLFVLFKNIKFVRKENQSIAPYSLSVEDDIQQMDLPGMLAKALADKNFKLAVRLYFLTLLKNLDTAGLIRWERDKTNRDYLGELFSKPEYYDDVRNLTRTYEEVWYGDHRFTDDSLHSVINKFEALNGRIKV